MQSYNRDPQIQSANCDLRPIGGKRRLYRTLYEDPLLYEQLRPTDPNDVQTVLSLLGSHCDRRIESVIYPACGPGGWLIAFAQLGYRVFGNDSSAEMCKVALDRLAGYDCQITQGNMTSLSFAPCSVDAAVEISGVVCELSRSDLVSHMRSISQLLRARGVYILCLQDVDERCLTQLPTRSWYSNIEAGDRIETIEYFIEAFHRRSRSIRMRRDVYSAGHLRARDFYLLRMYDETELKAFRDSIPGLSLVASLTLGQDDALCNLIRETYYVFRKQSSMHEFAQLSLEGNELQSGS